MTRHSPTPHALARRASLALLAIATLAACAGGGAARSGTTPREPAARDSSRVDLLVAGGTLVDGTGAPARAADVGVIGDRITFVGDARRSGITAARTIDARGFVVAPGFVDPHTHSLEDLSSEARKANLPWLMQGVTTVVTGNDGGGPVDVAATLARWERQGIGTNAALLVGHGTVRRRVLGARAVPPSTEQLDSMRALVDAAMREGALGLSTGLYYAPGSFANTLEVIEMAKVAARHGGIYDSHLRDESSYTVGLLAALREAIDVGRGAAIAVNVSHVKALGADVWGRSDSIVAIVERARREGVRVTADQYPYTASGSSIGAALLPRWAEAGGRDSLAARIGEPSTRARLVREMTDNLRRRGGDTALLITATRDTALRGRTLAQVAGAWRVSPVEAAIRIVQQGDAPVASFNMQEADIERLMRQPWVLTGSDGSAGHPRKYGTFARKLREYVLARGILDLATFVHRSSDLTARTFRIPDRGRVARGAFADVIVFDPATVRDRATYEQPELLAEGMRWVIVNGTVAVEAGRYTGALAGRGVRRAP